MGFLVTKLSDWLESLSPRDNRLAKIWIGGSSLALVLLLIFFGLSKVNSAQTKLKTEQNMLKQIESLDGKYRQALQKQRMEERKYALNPISLFSLMQAIATRLSLDLQDLNEQRYPATDSALVEYRVVVNLSKLSIDKLSAFLRAVEGAKPQGMVKVTALQIKTRFDSPDLLDASMTVSTWKMS